MAVLFDIWVREEEILKRLWATLQGKHLPARPTKIARQRNSWHQQLRCSSIAAENRCGEIR